MHNNRAAILLAAGQGSRLRPLTEGLPKCLLPVGGATILDTILPAFIENPEREIVVVAGYAADRVENHIAERYPGNRVKVVTNTDYALDVNILSLDIGVDALCSPAAGYTVVETDLLLAPTAWKIVREAEKRADSFWVTSGRYCDTLTGGIVHVNASGNSIDRIAYVPQHDAAFDGWYKMVGVLSVAPSEVDADRHFRKEEIQRSVAQYYMMPWVKYPERFPCVAVDLGTSFARSFNTVADYTSACSEYLKRFSENAL